MKETIDGDANKKGKLLALNNYLEELNKIKDQIRNNDKNVCLFNDTDINSVIDSVKTSVIQHSEILEEDKTKHLNNQKNDDSANQSVNQNIRVEERNKNEQKDNDGNSTEKTDQIGYGSSGNKNENKGPDNKYEYKNNNVKLICSTDAKTT